MVVARLSQNALCQSLNAGATTPIAAPAMTNWLNFPVRFCSTVYYGLLHARIDTGQNHGLIVSFGREREIRNEGEGSGTNADGADEVPAIERRCKTAAACAGNLMQISHCPSLGDGGTQLILAGIRCRRNGEAVSQGKSTVARADVARQFMSLRPRKAIFGPPAEIRPSASRCDRPA